VLKPEDFEVNEAWIAFRLNRLPIQTETDGDFNCLALMDAASLFILASELLPFQSGEMADLELRHLLRIAELKDHPFPHTVYVSGSGSPTEPAVSSSLHEIEIVVVPDNELQIFTREARDGFTARFEQ